MRTKIIVIVLSLIVVLFLLTGCVNKYIDDNGTEYDAKYGLAKIKSVDRGFIGYDPKTKVCYFVIEDLYVHVAGITPYYIIGEDGKPEIATYGQNYKGE